MAKEQHTHKLRRHVYKTGNSVYFCALPDCNFKIHTGLAIGKRSVCWRCGDPFIMTEYSIRLAKPHCTKCHKTKGATELHPNDTDTRFIPPILDKSVEDNAARDSANDLRSRLTGVTHSSIMAKPDDEDI